MKVEFQSVTFAIFGPFPPPRHGVSSVNEAVLTLASRSGISVAQFNTAPISLSRSLIVRLKRIGRVLHAVMGMLRFARSNNGRAIYFSLSGGLGLVYESGAILLARLAGAPVVVHHHSFRYVDASYWAMGLLTRIGGSRALHIVLSAEMEAKLKNLYPSIGRSLVISNAWLVDGQNKSRFTKRQMQRVGYLANLSPEKGIFDVVETAGKSAERGLAIEFVIAGPFDDDAVKRDFTAQTMGMKNVRYLGPVYGEEKRNFFESIDVFIFPTRYRNEAEPIVVLEALSVGCPVIAFARGCIPSLLNDCAGISIPCDQPFAACAVNELESWGIDPVKIIERRRAARSRFEILQTESRRAAKDLIDFLSCSVQSPSHTEL